MLINRMIVVFLVFIILNEYYNLFSCKQVNPFELETWKGTKQS